MYLAGVGTDAGHYWANKYPGHLKYNWRRSPLAFTQTAKDAQIYRATQTTRVCSRRRQLKANIGTPGMDFTSHRRSLTNSPILFIFKSTKQGTARLELDITEPTTEKPGKGFSHPKQARIHWAKDDWKI
ncbi:hypothetical protein RRG08_054199 [Elysia crispata]|uniref:Uncharacterized protein n=1 Tax=Elysia crispata TaxID=231223 RepID=A0AAE1CWJ5_9GAST|nr:hypothetical protein RRG08_054199 [Elysia crispata]